MDILFQYDREKVGCDLPGQLNVLGLQVTSKWEKNVKGDFKMGRVPLRGRKTVDWLFRYIVLRFICLSFYYLSSVFLAVCYQVPPCMKLFFCFRHPHQPSPGNS